MGWFGGERVTPEAPKNDGDATGLVRPEGGYGGVAGAIDRANRRRAVQSYQEGGSAPNNPGNSTPNSTGDWGAFDKYKKEHSGS